MLCLGDDDSARMEVPWFFEFTGDVTRITRIVECLDPSVVVKTLEKAGRGRRAAWDLSHGYYRPFPRWLYLLWLGLGTIRKTCVCTSDLSGVFYWFRGFHLARRYLSVKPGCRWLASGLRAPPATVHVHTSNMHVPTIRRWRPDRFAPRPLPSQLLATPTISRPPFNSCSQQVVGGAGPGPLFPTCPCLDSPGFATADISAVKSLRPAPCPGFQDPSHPPPT